MILDKICEHKKQEIERRMAHTPLRRLQETLELHIPTRDFRLALRLPGISLISEIKRSSPSAGMMREDLNAGDLAKMYEGAGARAISVLTDAQFFSGSFDDLAAAKSETSLPCLQKDFIVSEYQIYEARAKHADAILLIVRVLSEQQLRDYLELARSLGLAALVETHAAGEIETAIQCGAHIIGINNRDLDTLAVDINMSMNLRKIVPGGHVLVSESGIKTREHVRMLEDGGIDAILVGETLVTSGNPRRKVKELLCDDKG
jgi:indole-3-glycerol phosphate synthase